MSVRASAKEPEFCGVVCPHCGGNCASYRATLHVCSECGRKYATFAEPHFVGNIDWPALSMLHTDTPWAVDVVGYRLEEHWPKIQLFSRVEVDV